MKQKIHAMLDDDRGVSPVIGVILMVAITVILAAVIGTFVLGLGDQLQQAPQSTLNADSSSYNTVNISHDGGDALPASDTVIIVEGDRVEVTEFSDQISDGEFAVGDTIEVTESNASLSESMEGDTRVRVIHTPSESVIMDKTVDVPEESTS